MLNGIQVFHFKNVSNKLAYKNFPFAPTMAVRLKGKLNHLILFMCMNTEHFREILASYFANKFNVPLILQPRGTIPRYSNYAWKILFDKILGYPIINNACKVIASSHVESDQYGKIFPYLSKDKVIHIPNGINFDDYSDLPQKGQFKNKYG